MATAAMDLTGGAGDVCRQDAPFEWRPKNNLQNNIRAYPPCYFLKAAMISKVPVVRYLGFYQFFRQPKWLGANHPKYQTTVLLGGLIISISAFRKKHDRPVMLLRATSEQDPLRSGRYCKLFLSHDNRLRKESTDTWDRKYFR